MAERSAVLILDWRKHVLFHVVWSFLFREGELSKYDCEHILDCNNCLETFIICLKSNSFGSALMSLRFSEEEQF